MPVAETQDVTHDRGDGDAPRVMQSHLEPRLRVLSVLGEEMAHDGFEALADVFEDGDEVRVDVGGAETRVLEFFAGSG